MFYISSATTYIFFKDFQGLKRMRYWLRHLQTEHQFSLELVTLQDSRDFYQLLEFQFQNGFFTKVFCNIFQFNILKFHIKQTYFGSRTKLISENIFSRNGPSFWYWIERLTEPNLEGSRLSCPIKNVHLGVLYNIFKFENFLSSFGQVSGFKLGNMRVGLFCRLGLVMIL